MKLGRLSVIVLYFQQRELKSIGRTVQDFTLIIHVELPIFHMFFTEAEIFNIFCTQRNGWNNMGSILLYKFTL